MPKPKAVMHQVTVSAKSAGGGETSFHAQSSVWDERHGHLAFNKRDHRMRNEDYHLIEFVLDDETGDGLRFAAEPHDAMWVAKVDDPDHQVCPDAQTRSDYHVIDPICVCDDGRRLIVRNDNPRQEDWAFTLNFVELADRAKRVSWDPIIKNGGNGFV